MIHYLSNEQIDKTKWDNCNLHAINEIIYAYSWYLDLICDDWDALVEDDYTSIFPLPYRIKFGVKYIFQPFFCQQLGLISQLNANPTKLQEFLDAIPEDFKFIELNLNIYNQSIDHNFKFIENNNYELDLISSYDNIYANYSQNLKRNLKKATDDKLVISQHPKPEEIIDLFKHNMGKTIRTFKERDYDTLAKLIYTCLHTSIATSYGVYSSKNQLITAAIFIRSQHKSIFIFSANSEEGKNHHALPFIINEHIKTLSGQAITLDFEGSNNPNLARFYRSFGSFETHYYSIKGNHLSFASNLLLKVYKFIKK